MFRSLQDNVMAVKIELLNQLFKSRVFTVLPTRYRMNWSQMELIRSNELVV